MATRGPIASTLHPAPGSRGLQFVLIAGLGLWAGACASATVGDVGTHDAATNATGGSSGGAGGTGGKGGSGGSGGSGGTSSTSGGACDPFTNSGCSSGQKCTALQQTNGTLALGCGSVGSKSEGETCTQTASGGPQTGDNCTSGLACFATGTGASATCHRMCSPSGAGNPCPGSEICSLAAPGLDTVEFCRLTTSCQPLDQTGCASGQACYFSSTGALCALEGNQQPGTTCANANDCVKGSTCIVGAASACSSFCSMASGGTPVCTGAATGGSTCASLGNAAAGADLGYCK